ncbi:MAG: AtpZ/AtpI family protein [Bacteroidia bacterium]
MNSTNPQRPKKNVNSIIKYSGLAFQMIAVILILTYGGYKIDQWLGLKIPVFMIVFIIVGLGAYIYKLIKDL